ncbi:MAG: endolytic transglycosylase MltG [Geobacteraceae bacterium]|nr:endolytic transglycosylase MltG [Geobacteraceae bacterium]
MFPAPASRKKIIVSAVRICLSLLLIWYLLCLYLPAGDGSVVRDVSFPPGSGIRRLASELKAGGIIRSSWHFIMVTRLRGESHRLKAGDYRFNDGMTTAVVLRKLVTGDVDYRKFALPEGYSIHQAAELLEQKGYFRRDGFLEKCRDPELLNRLGLRVSSVEGYLYPATYNLSRGGSEEQLISQMVAQFEKKYAELSVQEGAGGGLSRHALVTLASLIEKEAVSPEEKPLISSVFHNRLRIGMPLQSDPTAVYGVRAFAGKVTRDDIERRSPYNTYLIKGLPPGPIGNPGAGALEAALHPAVTQYLYFVARQDGTHQFSRTLDEHNRAVQKYLK